MGVGKAVVKNKTKKAAENLTEDIPIVGDVVDKSVNSGPLDSAGDKLDSGKKKLDKKLDKKHSKK